MDPRVLVGSIFERKYRVDRVVAEGGFGIVYEAFHLALETQVALKVLRPPHELSRDEWTDMIHQFREEATALTRLRRSHVAAVLDSGIAPLDDDPMGLPWMVLEWLDGETLRDHLEARRGRGGRTRAECMSLLRPVLETIADAHEIKIAHRDLKPSNIMIVPTKAGPVPHVLDFGIAKMMVTEDVVAAADDLTDSQSPAFTASSAAPEQLAGSRTGPWTDVYALGLLITEVLTDRAPIPTEDPHERYRIAFAEARPTPASMGVDVGGWEPVLLRALAVKPTDRQRDAGALLDELDRTLHENAAVPTELSRDQAAVPANRAKRRTLARVALAAVGAGVLVAGGIGVRSALQERTDTLVFTSSARPFVIVSEFRAKGDPRLAASFGELLSAQLRVGDAMRLPAPDARLAMLEVGGLKGAIDPAGLARLREATGADVVIGGEIEDAANTLQANIELYDARRGTRIGTLTLSAPGGNINAFVREASARVRRGLARPALSIEDETALRSILPENPEASMAYVEGLAARRMFHFRQAASHFEHAIDLAPNFAPAHSSLAQARLMLGFQEAAREAAERAVKLAPALPRGDELLVYALAAEIRHDWAAAVENYRALAQFYPDRTDYVTSLARALVGAGKSADAMALLEKTRTQPQSDWDLVRIHLMESFAQSRQSKAEASLAAAKEAEKLAIKIGARVPMADAILSQAHNHHRGGRLDEAEALFNRARAIYADVNDTDNILNCDTALAEIASIRGDFQRAITIGAQIVEAHKASGNLYRRARVTTTLCIFHSSAGQIAKARALCEEGGRLYVQAKDREGEGWGLLNLAELDMRLGRLDGVADKLARGRAIHAEINQRAGVVAADAMLATVAWIRGRLPEAAAGFEKAFSEASAAGEAGLTAEVALHRARLAFARAIPEERARFDEAVKLVAASSDARLQALLDVHAARRALARKDLAEAQKRAVAAEDGARKSHSSEALALALAAALDAFADKPDGLTARRAELASMVDQLEAIEPQVEALLALSRAETGPRSSELTDRAVRVAREHKFVALEQLALRSKRAPR